ncbi:MAG: photosynthetic protein synthase I [Deltaproteobacteria bacterium HGW-Deltaproteobacteria-14]|jgi:protein SCO1/2|nr:MAG: photosynthetic protein synthase I [Deltaproteobacteria bacterium HGW-Deltaproteobacteria-14]
MTSDGLPPDAASAPRPLLRSPWLWAAVFGVVVLTGLKTCSGKRLVPLDKISAVPAFTLVDQAGRPFGSEDLKGHVWVASFIFTTCSTVCPRLSDANAELQRRFAAENLDARLVSFTVDPEMDRPALLTSYAQRYGADPARWTFLTTADGGTAALYELIAKGFQLAMGERAADSAGAVDISHSTKLVLVDADGFIRYYFDSSEDQLAIIVAYARELGIEAAEAAREEAAR